MERKIVFGLTLPVSRQVRGELEQTAARKIPSLQTVCRYRKEGIYQYAKQQQEEILIILEENLQGASPYTAEEIQQLADLGNNRIIFLLDRCHYGDDYVHTLYCCGVYDALYLDDISADGVMKLIKNGRNCAQSREYYGICTMRDAERQHNIVDEEYLNAYLECIEEGQGKKEINSRYRFAASRLGAEENRVLAGSITVVVANELVGNELYQFYKGGNKERRRWFPKRRDSAPKNEEFISGEDEEMIEIEQESESEIQKMSKTDDVATKIETGQENDAEDMFAIMEHFRMMTTIKVDGPVVESDEIDLLILMGNYLRTVDV